jgi:hypothetical protein
MVPQLPLEMSAIFDVLDREDAQAGHKTRRSPQRFSLQVTQWRYSLLLK